MALSLLPAGVSCSDFNRGAIGTSAAQFLKLAPGARGVALGEAYSAMADDASAMYWNPAGLIKTRSHSLVFMHSAYLASSFFDYLAYSQRQGDAGSWGFSVQYMNSGEITRTDASGVEEGVFTPSDIAIAVGFASDISGYRKDPEERFSMGAAGKVVRSKILSSNTTLAADAGFLSPCFFDRRFQMSFSAQNIVGSLKFNQESYPLPLIFRLGTKTSLTRYWDVTADLAAPRDNYPYLAMGTEVRINASKTATMSVRAGFNTRSISDLEGSRNFSLGFGLAGRTLSVDYAFVPFGDLGNTHRLSVGFSF